MVNREEGNMKLAYNMKELGPATGLGRTKLFELCATGELVVVKIGRRTLVTAASAEALIARHTVSRTTRDGGQA